MKGNARFRNARSPVPRYCSHMYSDSSAPLLMSSAFHCGEAARAHEAFDGAGPSL